MFSSTSGIYYWTTQSRGKNVMINILKICLNKADCTALSGRLLYDSSEIVVFVADNLKHCLMPINIQ